MRELTIQLGETAFNVIWRSLHDREQKLQASIDNHDEESDEAIVANNDIIYLRTLKESLQQQAEAANFQPDSFELSEATIDLLSL